MVQFTEDYKDNETQGIILGCSAAIMRSTQLTDGQ